MQRNDTQERQQQQRDDCIRGLAGCKKQQQIKKALEGERLRQMERMADRESEISQLELTAQMVAARLRGRSVTKLQAVVSGSAGQTGGDL